MLRRRRPRWVAIFLAVALVVVGWRIWVVTMSADSNPIFAEGTYRVDRTESDLTLVLENGGRVRLLGVVPCEREPANPGRVTPISTAIRNHIANEAREFLSVALTAKPVRIQFDRERVDPSGVLMAYVFFRPTPADESLLNEVVLAKGWGTVDLSVYFNESHKRHFRQAEADAREKQRGRWAKSDDPQKAN